MSATPRIEIVVIRDPDSGTYAYPYIDGAAVPLADYTEYVIDASAGHTTAEWAQRRDAAIASASPVVAEQLRRDFNDPPGACDIIGDWPPTTQ
ncbi:hypothetical protein [Mycolicibacterium houstonense]|uniref:hypothetical protein n=1 Tax=Mycolicibacterium houstonense TaxID=146021 RepID=UPI003F9CD44B